MQKIVALALAMLACNKGAPTEKQAEKKNSAQPQPTGGEIRVAGASDLVFAMEDLIKEFAAENTIKVAFIPGSSGKLAAQIKEGAPFDVFMSANEAFIDDVTAGGDCLADTKARYAQGRIVMWAPKDGKPLPATLEGLKEPAVRRIAIAQPEHAPYGMAAKQAFEKLGIWPQIQPKLVYGSNIKDTMQMAETGNADAAIIALALTQKSQGQAVDISPELHQPILQGLVVCKRGHEVAAKKFAEFVLGETGQAILKRYGFAAP